MTEQDQPKTEQTKNATLKVVLDHSFQEQKLREELDKAHEQIGALLKSEHEKFDLEAERKHLDIISGVTPISDPNSPPLEAPKKEVWTMKNFDFENSAVLDMNPKFESTEAAMDYIKKIAENPQAVDYKIANELYAKLATKALKQGGTFEYQGNLCRYERQGNQVVKSNRPKIFKKVEN